MTLHEQKAICDKATPGPWNVCPMEMYIFGSEYEMVADVTEVNEETLRIRGYGARLPMQENGTFITAARTEWPKLIEEHRKALDEIERLRNENRSLKIQLDAANLSWA